MTTLHVLVDRPVLILVPSFCQLMHSKFPRGGPLAAPLFIKRLVNCFEFMEPQERSLPPFNLSPASIHIIGLEDALQGEVATYGVRGVKFPFRMFRPKSLYTLAGHAA